MVVKRGGLGRNLSALLSPANNTLLTDNLVSNLAPRHLTLATHCLQPGKYQPRREMTENALLELSESIKQQGLLQPLVVREIAPGNYEIIAGERRWRACQMAGKTEVPVIVHQVDDETAMAISLVENLQREDLNAMDQALAMQRLVNEFSLTHQQIADLLCKSRTAVSNFLRLLNLHADVRRLLEHGDLDMGHARCLLMLDDAQQPEIARMVVSRELSVRETEALVARVKAGVPFRETKPVLAPLFSEQLQTLAHQLQTKVKIKPGTAGRGTLIIHYDDTENLESMIGLLLERA